ncbi:MAG: LamG domain-containing protein, partial [Rhodothermales bacterium]|nr:LamG domain-containing protein [Rhodothermales bacterium]
MLPSRTTRFTLARLAIFATFVALLVFAGAGPASAQFRLVGGGMPFSDGQEGSLFVTWEGSEQLAEARLRLPPRWNLVEASAVQQGRRVGVSWSRPDDQSDVLITPADAVEGRVHLVLKLQAPEFSGGGFWSLTPLIAGSSEDPPEAVSALAFTDRVVTEPVRLDEENLVASFDGRTRIEMRGRRLPVFAGDRSYTIEFWFKTTGLGEILLSAWNGDESFGYPVEVVTAADGRIQLFRGESGRHLSMSSERPAADGRWHHLAVVHDEVRGWTRMLVDGVATDSLSGHTDPVQMASFGRLCLGGRCSVEPSSSGRRGPGYRGKLDLVRFWPTARTVRQIEKSMSDIIPPVAGMVALSFDRSMSEDLILTGADIRVEPSDFLFYDQVEDLTASWDKDAVMIGWKSRGRNTVQFIVERSVDAST